METNQLEEYKADSLDFLLFPGPHKVICILLRSQRGLPLSPSLTINKKNEIKKQEEKQHLTLAINYCETAMLDSGTVSLYKEH